jgi:predicted lipoprotein with Yx(FWY)xxD motif
MKKSSSIIIAIMVIIVIAGGGYALFHKSSKTTPASTSTSKQTKPAVTNAVLITKTDATVGQYLADPSGKALYTYGGDSAGVSNCTSSCLANWPAYQDKGSTTNLPSGISTIKRSDNGETQYTYIGMPLYYFVSDGPGQVTGNGVENFHVAVPSGASSSTSQSTTNSSSSSSNSSSGYPY